MYIKTSRIGKIPIYIPHEVNFVIKNHSIVISGPLGQLRRKISSHIQIEVKKNNQKNFQEIKLKILKFEKEDRSFQGLYRSLIHNMLIGVTRGFTKILELIGIGYKASIQGQLLEISVGFSHLIILEIPLEVKMEIKIEKGKNIIIIIKSHNKQLLGLIAAKIRSFKRPDVYKGKGIRYFAEAIRKKVGKSA